MIDYSIESPPIVMTTNYTTIRIVRIRVNGVVQGVGFRPFVYRLATELGAKGWVCNDSEGVNIHVELLDHLIPVFLHKLRSETPSAALISGIKVQDVQSEQHNSFIIRNSQQQDKLTTRISPDLCVCDQCIDELFLQSNARFAYPYINCTNCGPRYSIIHQLPYDRVRTSMRDWSLCELCQMEYTNPSDRRYHAQPIACPCCGPDYYLSVQNQKRHQGSEAIAHAAMLLREGHILAIKGIGGYHLACDAHNSECVKKLRNRKYRKEKPFAIMVKNIQEAEQWICLHEESRELLASTSRPIVLAKAKQVLPGIAPDSQSLGVMLPYAPLHHLLFANHSPSPLVLTSANQSSEPIAHEDDDAQNRLCGIADGFLIGERPIVRRVDDSVVTLRRGRPFILRRSRGLSPGVVATLPCDQPILALGADLKNAIAIVIDGQVIISQHIGDLGDVRTNQAFRETVEDLLTMYSINKQNIILVHDLHPQYESTQFGTTFPSLKKIAVQHHHAHAASVLAEYGMFTEKAVAVIFDGTGYGEDHSVWGGEIFTGSVQSGFERIHHLLPVMMPGGDAAATFPPQAAAGFLAHLTDLPDMSQAPFHFPKRFHAAMKLAHSGTRCFRSTSMGRFFDAMAALLGFTREISYEGQAAVWLEELAKKNPQPAEVLPFPELDFRPLLSSLIAQRLAGRDPAELAFGFHAGIAEEVVNLILRYCERESTSLAVLSGGVFQNELLVDLIYDALSEHAEIKLLINHQVPANDGGICLGQAAIAAFS